MADAIRRMAFEPDRRTGEYLFCGRHRRQPAAARARARRSRRSIGLVLGHRDRPPAAASRATLGAVRRGRSRWSRRWRSCRSCSSSFGPRRDRRRSTLIVIGVAPFLVRDLVACASASCPREQIDQGADARRLDLADRAARRAAADHAAADHRAAPVARAGLAVPDRGRGDRLDRAGSATASSWSAAILAMDVILPYVAWITLLAFVMDSRCVAVAARRLSAGRTSRSALMSAISVRDVWSRLRRRRSCSSASTSRSPRGAFVTDRRRLAAAARPPSCACSSAQERPTARQHHRRRRAAAGRARAATAASCSSAIRCSRI